MQRSLKFWEEQMDLLAQQDYVVIDQFLNTEHLKTTHDFFNQKQAEDVFKKAAIGASGSEKIIREIRGDYTFWLDKQRDQEIRPFFEEMDEVKEKLNQLMYLSLSDYEFHLAHYPSDSFYKKHLDQFDGRRNRMISVIIYLNQDWKTGDGGELRVYPEGQNTFDIPPLENRMVMFRSDVLHHEVLKSNTSRKSITGWMLYQPAVLPYLAL
ncbi:2OG-Fe(II) oxygenase [Brumimicrobium aurantiacum]|uniref:2OG-Fe(II) oxygenase n=1 Tax=Brumimicrobium aurantiacum TaxID=1737063 RepID=A0A3E1EWP5_9FLAO|nr:2OG-Fe(II) oxygenase [Brumimicrobium aurantiacum]RFC53980.1 2OG-Fe(II) oxygenase [Brumimicrobium aurantiacum]